MVPLWQLYYTQSPFEKDFFSLTGGIDRWYNRLAQESEGKDMAPVFSFIAWSGTGKTTYLEALIAALKARGARVAAVKHDAHRFDLDREGKDSWRFARAGAEVVAIADGEKCAVMDYRPVRFNELLSRIRDVDLILVEGWHAEAGNPILLHRAGTGQPPKLSPADCFAVVSDTPLDAGGRPCFPLDDPAPLADFLLAQLDQFDQ